MTPRGGQSTHSLFYEDYKQYSTWMECLAPEKSTIKKYPEGAIPRQTMAVVKWSEAVKGSGYDMDDKFCSGLYKNKDKYIVTWVVTDPNANMNCLK